MVFCFFVYSSFANLSTWCLVALFQSSLLVLADVPPSPLWMPLFWFWGCFTHLFLIEITKSIVGHFKAVLRGVFVIKTSVFIIIAFNRTPCHKMLIYSSMVNVSWLYLLIPAYTNFPLTTYLLYLIVCYLLLIK